MPLHAAIFDLDGLLIDSEPLQLRSINHALAAVGLSLSEDDWTHCVGHKSIEVLGALREQHSFALPAEDLERVKRETYRELVRQPGELHLMPGAREAVDACHAAGLRVALASSSVRADILAILDLSGLTAAFEVITGGDEVARGKPDPAIFLEAARRLGVAPPHCICPDDAPAGIEAANAAGMISVAIPNRFSAHLDFSHARYTLPDLAAFARALPALVASDLTP